MAKKGRPTTFTQEIADTICEQLATSSKSLKKICKELDLNAGTVLAWLSSNKEFQDQYARAKEEQADLLADEILEISDDGTNDTYMDDDGNARTDQDVIQRSKLRVDARKWLASKLKPKKYGDKTDITSGGNEIKPMAFIVTTTDKELAKDINEL